MSDDASINTELRGGNVGVAGAHEVHVRSQNFISNFFGTAPPAPEKPTGPIPRDCLEIGGVRPQPLLAGAGRWRAGISVRSRVSGAILA
jgi:hypothetical protein